MMQSFMTIQQNISLKPFNSFGIDVNARYFTSFQNETELIQAVDFYESKNCPLLVLGGGSNVLFTQSFNGLVLKNEWQGIHLLKEDEEHVYLQAGAGYSWHGFVQYCIQKNLGGVENLSLIPGSVGASPMQNIGAYGVEIKDVFHCLEAYDLEDKKKVQFSNSDCEFGYRESVFKNSYRNRFVILNVTYRLSKKHSLRLEYGAIKAQLEIMGVQQPTIANVSAAVMAIRQSKLPNPAEIGNAGSFFKNPEVDAGYYEALKKDFPTIVGYPLLHQKVKLAAGWLIEQCGWKGYRSGDAGCHARQALVLVNYGRATGAQIFELSEAIIASVQEKFGVTLSREVNIY